MKILIPDGTNTHALRVITCLKHALACEIHVISRHKYSKTRFSRYCDIYHYSRAQTPAQRLGQTLEIADKYRIEVIFPIVPEGIMLVDQNRRQFDKYIIPPGPKAKQVAMAEDKWRFCRFMAKHNLSCVPTVLIDQGRISCGDALEQLRFPVVYKPAHGQGGDGIVRLDSRESLERFLHAERPGRGIIQEYIRGHDLVCSVLCLKGRIVCHTMHKPIHLDKEGFAFARSMRFVQEDIRIMQAVAPLMSALRWNGIANIDMRYCPRRDKVCVLELNARYWATLLDSMSVGVNFPYLALRAATGEQITPARYADRYCFTTGQWLRNKLGRYGPDSMIQIQLRDTNIGYLLKDPLPRLLGTAFRVLAKKQLI